MVTRVEVNSTAIRAVRREGNGDVTVEFSSGTEASYADVPEDVFQEFVSADSVGRYFNQNIKGVYDER